MKNEIEHTPGPWVVRDEYDGTLPVDGWDEDLDASVEIARVSLDMLTPDQREANARLIAAAPELLAALEALCAWHSHEALTGLPDGAPVASWAPSFDKTVKMVHAAIAKAKGEA